MVHIGQFAPATRAMTCQYCGAAVEVGAAYAACGPCDTMNLASDRYKERHGFRPRGLTLREARAIVRAAR